VKAGKYAFYPSLLPFYLFTFAFSICVIITGGWGTQRRFHPSHLKESSIESRLASTKIANQAETWRQTFGTRLTFNSLMESFPFGQYSSELRKSNDRPWGIQR
jgi:hypothetical protein